jgi:dienelactone hydrolase
MPRQILQVLTLCLFLIGVGAADAKTTLIELNIGGNIALGDLVVPEGTSIENGVVLITHGTLAHKDMELIATLQSLLAERGISTLAHSLTFNQDKRTGLYDCTKPHTHAHEDAVNEIAAWVDWLKSKGAKKISALGYSRGGNQVAWFASEKTDLAKFILMAPATGSTRGKSLDAYKRRFKSDLEPVLEKAARLVKSKEGDSLLELPGFIYCQKSRASAKTTLSYYGNEPRRMTASLIPKIEQPVLIITGSKDTVVPDAVEKYTPVADGKHVRLEVIDDADHWFLDFFAEDASDLIAEFLKE